MILELIEPRLTPALRQAANAPMMGSWSSVRRGTSVSLGGSSRRSAWVNVTALVWVLPALFAVGADVLIAIVVLGVVPLVGGIGTIASRRWGWVVSLVAVTLGILFGIASWAFQGVVSTTAEGLDVEWTWLTVLVLPALAMLGALLAPATLRWLRVSVAV